MVAMAIARLSYAKGNDPFYAALRARVREYLAAPGRTRWGSRAMRRKSLALIALFVALGAAVYRGRLSGGPFVAALVAWQFVQFLMTIGIAHDAAHGAYSRSARINARIVKIFDFFGIDAKHWIETHVDSHHAMPNVPLRDSAIESFSMVRLHPRTRASPLSRHQHRYMFLVYSMVTLFQVYLLEPVAFAQNVVGFERKPGWGKTLATMLAKKAFVLGYSLILPLVVLQQNWYLIVGGWWLGHMACGLAIGVIFQTTHLHEGTSFVEPDEKGRLPHSFATHILRTTSEFSTDSPFVTWICGGLNLHVTHHLFPRVSQVHLPALSRIVRRTAHEYGVPYTAYTFLGALRSHLRMLKRLGSLPAMASPSLVSRPPRDPGVIARASGSGPPARSALPAGAHR